jgi:DNA primase
LSLDKKRNRFKCFACGASGDVFDLYTGNTGLSKYEALKALESWAGIQGEPVKHRASLPPASHRTRPEPEPPLTPTKIEKGAFSHLYEALKDFCGGADPESLAYLTGSTRGLTRATIDRFGIFSLPDYKKTKAFLLSLSQGSLEDLKRAGLAYDNGRLVFGQHRLLIPFTERGRILFLQGRSLKGYGQKYQGLNGVSVSLFNADTLEGMKPGDPVYICEGAFDAMILEQRGRRAVGIQGVHSFKPEWVDRFKGLDVILALDNDEAGRAGAERLRQIFLERGLGVKVLELPKGIKDITEFFLSPDGKKAL